MFLSKKDADVEATAAAEAPDEVTAPPQSEWAEDSVDVLPPQPEWADASADLSPPRASDSLPEEPSDLYEEPSDLHEEPSLAEGHPDQPVDAEATKLVIAREIVLNGEINSCDLLVVEGTVEATMKGCREIKITETGTFKGQVQFERADISGVFEGDLTAREHLVVRSTGRVTGKVRFGELEIERGGQVLGDVQVFGNDAAADQQAKGAVEKQAN